MKRKTILLADTSAGFCDALSQLLSAEFEVWTCSDGTQALAMLEKRCPDVLVTDLALPGVDGLCLLRTGAAMAKRPALLAITCYQTPFIQEAVAQIGVDYMMLKPCNTNALAERIWDLSHCGGLGTVLPLEHKTLNSILLALGIPAGRKGFTYLEIIIRLYCRDGDRSLTKDLYPTVGRSHGTNGAAVERTIRSAIETAWLNRDELVWRQYFPVARFGTVAKPTNLTFIATIASALQMRQRRQA